MAKTALEQWDETAANNLDRGGVNIAEGCNPSDINNAMRELMSQVAKWLGDDTIASAATTDLGSKPGRYVEITGTTTITGFGTIKAGTIKFVKFAGVLTLTHDGTSLILPGSGNIVTAAGDTAIFGSEGSGNWRCLSYQRAAAAPDPFGSALLHVVDEKTTNTNAGTASAGNNVRTLNTVRTNEIAGASLSSDVITLPAGTYYVEASAPAYNVGTHKITLFNTTGGSQVIYGQGAASVLTENQMMYATLRGRFTLAAQGTLQLRHYVATSSVSSSALGTAANLSAIPEVYSEVLIWKIR